MTETNATTLSLEEFQARYERDDSLWWRIGCGDHQNAYDAAIEALDDALTRAGAAEAVVGRVIDLIRHARNISPGLGMTIYVRDLEHALGGGGPRPHKLGQHDG